MASFRKNLIILLVLGIIFALAAYLRNQGSDKSASPNNFIHLKGMTMGTSYSIKYLDDENYNYQEQIDSLLQLFNQSLSTYIPESEISRFNKQDTFYFESPFFLKVLEKSKNIYELSNGAFDPTVMPLVNAWGFGPDNRQLPDSATIDSLMMVIGFDKIRFDQEKVYKTHPHVQLDFSAIAKGYGSDIIAGFLKEKGISDLMVEIGGEIVANGVNFSGELWEIGITNPIIKDSPSKLYAIVKIDNKGMATSGNYYNFYENEGKIISHTISPVTGYPVRNELLSATILANDCMTADAIATTCMVLGLEKSKEIINNHPEIEGYFIYSKGEGLLTYVSEGLKNKNLISEVIKE